MIVRTVYELLEYAYSTLISKCNSQYIISKPFINILLVSILSANQIEIMMG